MEFGLAISPIISVEENLRLSLCAYSALLLLGPGPSFVGAFLAVVILWSAMNGIDSVGYG